ncbi:NUDIX domain-containing protein [Kushneria phosphatilytica]|uniref:ADP-ribose pyrophosphatase n=1 Tax=Kushneria phosphatilytica TaxID=657387 RepID=A0A5C1A0L6_9GAMM|nr:NUDIX domain-containing protein [Kushneria phosphatilytica]QEL11676.1 NUDIX domain-containing protein [Kushneria phosphatilytica]
MTQQEPPASRFGREDVERVADECLYDGFFDLYRRQLRYRRFGGGWSETVTREVHVRHDAVGVLLYDPERDAVVLVEQCRAGALDRPRTPWLIEPVAGLIDSNESPEAVARREAEEEAGCRVDELIEIQRYFPSPGACSEYVTLYCALVDSRELGGVHGLDSEHEDILVHVLPFTQAWQLLEEGHLDNAMALIAMYWLARERASLRARR